MPVAPILYTGEYSSSPSDSSGAGFEVHTGWEEAIAGLKLKIQLYCGDEIAMGPGKAELLRQITAQGSISAAARAMGMSYRRAWLLVDAMNRCFRRPLVEARPGRGGA
ncbi:MAG: winged helix-turn-helix domain-containing protein, partial [Allosphingosinicella sp.]